MHFDIKPCRLKSNYSGESERGSVGQRSNLPGVALDHREELDRPFPQLLHVVDHRISILELEVAAIVLVVLLAPVTPASLDLVDADEVSAVLERVVRVSAPALK